MADAAVEAVAAVEVDADDKQTIDEEGAEPNKSRSSLKNQPGTWRPQMIQDPNLRSESLANVPPTRLSVCAMKGTARFLLILAIGTALPSLGQVASSSPSGQGNSDFEELPELKASEILKPEVFQGPHHTVRESVPTSSGMNQFVIDSDFGVFDADGNEMLLRRVKEVYAIVQLKDVSKTDQFKQSLLTAAQGPYNAAKNLVKDPVTAVSNVPKGMMKFMGRAGQSIKNIGKKDESQSEGRK